MNSILYRRVSTAKQDISLEAQNHAQVQYCERLGAPVLEVFADPDTSGSIKMRDREGGGKMMAFLETRSKAALSSLILVTHKQDRMGRDTLDQVTTIRRIWELGVIPHFIEEGGALPRTPTNEMLFEIKASVAQYERNMIRQRIRDASSTKFRLGERWGQVPFGWRTKSTGQFRASSSGSRKEIYTVEQDPEEQIWLRSIIHWRSVGTPPDGPWSFERIAKELNRNGVRSKRAGEEIGRMRPASGRWDRSVVRALLLNRYVKQVMEEINGNSESRTDGALRKHESQGTEGDGEQGNHTAVRTEDGHDQKPTIGLGRELFAEA